MSISVACSNKDSGKDVRAVCKVGCIGCGVCHRTAADLFSVKDHLSQIDYDQYDPEKMDAARLAGVPNVSLAADVVE